MSADLIVFTTTRYRCPHCRRSYSHRATAAKHEQRCFRNPAIRSCKTCLHWTPPGPEQADECSRDVDLSVSRCPSCGEEVDRGDGSCPAYHTGQPVQGLRVQCPLWTAEPASPLPRQPAPNQAAAGNDPTTS